MKVDLISQKTRKHIAEIQTALFALLTKIAFTFSQATELNLSCQFIVLTLLVTRITDGEAEKTYEQTSQPL